VEPERFFTRWDCTAEVSEIFRTIEEKIGEMQLTVGRNPCPEVQIGPHCDNPYGCPLKDQCWGFLPEHSVMNLYRGKAKGFDLLGLEETQMKDIPSGFALTANQRVQVKSLRSGKPRVSKPALRRFLEGLEYPVHYVDFETFSTAIPLFDGLRPFQRVPFQFSLHIQRSPDAELDHHSFLADGRGDPRREFMERLRESVDEAGSLVTYNAAFEKGVLKECADSMPEFQPWVDSLKGRFVDLLQPFRAFRYYHPSQRGSASMKSVLPALTGEGYENLAIQDGEAASREYVRVTFREVAEEDRDRVRRDLEIYCGLDTEGMWQIVTALTELA